MKRLVLAVLFGGLVSGLASANPMNLDVFTSFEVGDMGPTFGTSPVTATFVGGASVFEATPGLYHDGIRSWRTDAGSMTSIQFETPASIVEFYALDVGAADAVVTAFDPAGGVIGDAIHLTNEFPGPMMQFDSPYSISGVGPIGALVLSNPGGGASYLDSFGFSALVEPPPPPPGSSPDNPYPPTSGGDGEPFVFSDAPSGRWFDPPLAGGYFYETDGDSNFTLVRPPPQAIVPDGDGQYLVSSIHGDQIVAADATYVFPSPVGSFRILGIDPLVDGGEPLGFPTFLDFDQTPVTFFMSPIPEPATIALAMIGIPPIGFRLIYNRRRRSRARSKPRRT